MPPISSPSTAKDTENEYSTEVAEPLSKCCTSVVPKKRKHHFETKHRMSFFKAARLRRQQQPIPSDIYINLDPSPIDMSDCEPKAETTVVGSHSAFLPVSCYNLFTGYSVELCVCNWL